MIATADKKYRFVSLFDPETGFGVRSNIYDEDGSDTREDPFMASFPELLDVGIMGHCAHGKSGLCIKSGVECYQNGLDIEEPNMPLSHFKKIIDECRGHTFQIALGGRGDPDMHEDFVNILRYARENGVVCNFTTSGFGLKKELLAPIKEFCGAVAVSFYRSEYTYKAVDLLLSAGIKTNIHYCLSNKTIDEAVGMMTQKSYPKGINRIIFLLHKPVGLGRRENVLSVSDERVKRFFSLFDEPENANMSGFDSCSVPALLNFTEKLHPETIEPCEAGRFSAYISPDFKLYPCSFEKRERYGMDLEKNSIEEAWEGEEFNEFRKKFENRCTGCVKYSQCLGGCPVLPEVTLCKNEYKTKIEVRA